MALGRHTVNVQPVATAFLADRLRVLEVVVRLEAALGERVGVAGRRVDREQHKSDRSRGCENSLDPCHGWILAGSRAPGLTHACSIAARRVDEITA